jgi:tetratricopeptide (TPR) repeat protein
LQINPHNIYAYSNLAIILAQSGETDESMDTLEQALLIHKDCADLLCTRADILLTMGQVKEAIRGFERTIELKPDSAVSYYKLGSILEKEGKLSEAMRLYLKAVHINSPASFLPLFSDLEPDYPVLRESFEGIKGFLAGLEGYTLMRLAERGPGTGEIVEIGSYMGKSTCWMATGTQRASREKVTAVDHFRGSSEHRDEGAHKEEILAREGTTFNSFMENVRMMQLADYVQPVIAPSEEAVRRWGKPIRLLFIDGDHSYESSKMDFELWSPFVAEGGCIAFHDILIWEGVTLFYNELMQSTSRYHEVLSVMSLRVIQKK